MIFYLNILLVQKEIFRHKTRLVENLWQLQFWNVITFMIKNVEIPLCILSRFKIDSFSIYISVSGIHSLSGRFEKETQMPVVVGFQLFLILLKSLVLGSFHIGLWLSKLWAIVFSNCASGLINRTPTPNASSNAAVIRDIIQDPESFRLHYYLDDLVSISAV